MPERLLLLALATLTEAVLAQPEAVTRIEPLFLGVTRKVTVPLELTFFLVETPAPFRVTVGLVLAVDLTVTVTVFFCFARTR